MHFSLTFYLKNHICIMMEDVFYLHFVHPKFIRGGGVDPCPPSPFFLSLHVRNENCWFLSNFNLNNTDKKYISFPSEQVGSASTIVLQHFTTILISLLFYIKVFFLTKCSMFWLEPIFQTWISPQYPLLC